MFRNLKQSTYCLVSILLVILTFVDTSLAATKYIRDGAPANGTGDSWATAYNSFAAAGLQNSSAGNARGNTYYVATGNYGSLTLANAESGTSVITIKKATAADHGESVTWSSSYDIGPALLGSNVIFKSSYWVIDGNGVHTFPSDNPSAYGFKVSHSGTGSDYIFNIGFGLGNVVTNITIKYVYGYNTENGSVNNAVKMVGTSTSLANQYLKFQNCFFENSGQDGFQFNSSDNILVEKCYIKRLGKLLPQTPDYHGQTVQAFYGNSNLIFRYNIWEANEGQALISYNATGASTSKLRFYGNIVFVKYGQTSATPGFNSGGGIIGNAWAGSSLNEIVVYNNTYVNIGGDYGGVATFRNVTAGTDVVNYNGLMYNCQGVGNTGWNVYGYHASGGGDAAGGTNEQTGLSSSIFSNYSSNDLDLASATTPGLNLTTQSWWKPGADSFFGFIDSDLDLKGRIRGEDGIWDRGAYEYKAAVTGTVPAAPSNLKVIQ